MTHHVLTKERFNVKQLGMVKLTPLIPAGLAFMVSGCVTLAAPEKPIEINLNINIKQEVIVKLQKDAQDIISNNPELFPK
jgi:hypothetical protein